MATLGAGCAPGARPGLARSRGRGHRRGAGLPVPPAALLTAACQRMSVHSAGSVATSTAPPSDEHHRRGAPSLAGPPGLITRLRRCRALGVVIATHSTPLITTTVAFQVPDIVDSGSVKM